MGLCLHHSCLIIHITLNNNLRLSDCGKNVSMLLYIKIYKLFFMYIHILIEIIQVNNLTVFSLEGQKDILLPVLPCGWNLVSHSI